MVGFKEIGFSIFLGLLVSSNNFLSAEPIYLKPRVILSKPTVSLSDIARLPKDTQNVTLFDLPNEPMILSPNDIKEKIGKDYAEYNILGSNTLIIPLTQEFNKDDLKESLLGELVTKTGRSESEFRLTYEGENIFAPSENVLFKWAGLAKDLTPGKKIFSLETWYKGTRINSNRLKFTVEFKVKGIFANKNLNRLTLLKDTDTSLQEFYTLDNPTDLVLGSITGMTLLAPLKEGDVIRKKHVRNLHVIEKGSDVDIVFVTESILVKGRGTAKESGNTGEEIKVLSKSNGQIIKGKVAEKGWVIIE